MKASGRKTPQPSPAIHSAVLRAQGDVETQGYIGTPDQLATLRQLCLERDHHRCVVSQRFDQSEAIIRFGRDGEDAQDDDGNFLRQETSFEILEVAHILPHSLMKVDANLQMVRFPATMICALA